MRGRNIQVWVRGAGSTAVYDAAGSDTFASRTHRPTSTKTETPFPATGAPIPEAETSGGPR
jgi:hypothetical protein